MIIYAFLSGTGTCLVKIGLNKLTGVEITLRGLFRNLFRTFYQILKVPLLVLGALLTVIGFLTYQYMLALYDLSLVKPLQTLSIIFILLWGFKYLKERINSRELIGITVLLIGSVLISIYTSGKSQFLNFYNLISFAIILIILSIFFIIITVIKKDKKLDEFFLAIASGLLYSLGMIFNNAFFIFEIEKNGKVSLSFQLLLNPYLYLVIISYFLAVFVLLVAFSKGRLSIAASTISFITYGIPILGAIFIFNENLLIPFADALIFPFSYFKLLGIILIFCGIAILYPRIRYPTKNALNNSS